MEGESDTSRTAAGDSWLDEGDVNIEGLEVQEPLESVDPMDGVSTQPRRQSSVKRNPLTKRLRPEEAATALDTCKLLASLGLKDGSSLNDALAALRQAAEQSDPPASSPQLLPLPRQQKAEPEVKGDNREVALQDVNTPQTVQGSPTRSRPALPHSPHSYNITAGVPAVPGVQYEDFNRILEETIQDHYRSWMGNVRAKASRAIDWVLQSMLEDAGRGKVKLQYDIPPGQEDFLHESFPAWMNEERGIEVLRTVVQEELLLKGFKAPTDALEKKSHGQNQDRFYFRLTYNVPAPSELIPTSPILSAVSLMEHTNTLNSSGKYKI